MNASFFKINFSCKNTQEEKTTIRISEFFSSAPQEVRRKRNLEEIRGLKFLKTLVLIFFLICSKINLKALKKQCQL
jgi:hypothetical protein